MLVLRVVFFCAHVLLALAELKSLLLKRDELVTDLKNIMYHHADAVEKLTKIKADADKQAVSDMKQIRNLAADRDRKAQQLANLEAAAQVVIDMVMRKLVVKVCWIIFGKPSSDSVASSPTPPGITWPMP